MNNTLGFIRAYGPDGLTKTQTDRPRSSRAQEPSEPPASFVRGVIVALAVAIPVWAWIMVESIR
jgi:hypothetical protein